MSQDNAVSRRFAAAGLAGLLVLGAGAGAARGEPDKPKPPGVETISTGGAEKFDAAKVDRENLEAFKKAKAVSIGANVVGIYLDTTPKDEKVYSADKWAESIRSYLAKSDVQTEILTRPGKSLVSSGIAAYVDGEEIFLGTLVDFNAKAKVNLANIVSAQKSAQVEAKSLDLALR